MVRTQRKAGGASPARAAAPPPDENTDRVPKTPMIGPNDRTIPMMEPFKLPKGLAAAKAAARAPAVSAPPPDEPEEAPAPTLRRTEGSSGPRPAQLRALESLALPKDKAPPPQRSGGSKLPWILFFLTAMGAGGYHYYPELRTRPWFPKALGGGEPVPQPGTAAIKTLSVTPVPRPSRDLVAAGYVAARAPITVGVVIPGRVNKVLVTNGARVKKGQELARLDDSQPRAELALALARKNDAERLLQRTRSLAEAQAATPTDVDRAQGQAEIAAAALRPIQERIEQAKVKAPIGGTVVDVLAHPGEVVAANAGVIKLADLGQLVSEMDVNEGDLPLVRRGQSVEVISEAFPGKTFKGVVREIAEQADRARGTVLVKVDLEVRDESLRPGMAVKASFKDQGGNQAQLLIPRSAVDGGAVWLVGADSRAARQPVTTQLAGADQVEVLSGLRAGDRIVVDGHGVQAGQRIP